MKLKIGKSALFVPLTLALIIGVMAAAQQQSQQQGQQGQQDQTQQKKQDAATNPDRPTNQTDTTRGTDKDRDVGAYSKQGMYDKYRRHWDTRFHDPDFMTFQEQQMKQRNAERTQNTAGQTGDHAQQQRKVMTYDQFSQDSKQWKDRNSAATAWQRSDAYWRMSDRYWRDPARRETDGFKKYSTQSDTYWNDSDQYWDMYFSDSTDNAKDPADQRNQANR